jgi:hypothetical protein
VTRRELWIKVAPLTLLVAALAIAPLASGARTFYLRDVFATHLPLKAAQVEAWRAGELPLVDLARGGGQPGLGNPNSVPFYPTNVLYLVGPLLWALNAHFWIHWIAAAFAMGWLARAWGLERAGAAAAGLAYAASGYFVSQLSYYNAVAGAALGPAVVASVLQGSRAGWPARRIAASGALVGLVVLGGEPFLAAMALAAAAFAELVDGWRRPHARPARRLLALAPIALGLALAAPALWEASRVFGASHRAQPIAAGDALLGSFDPRQAIEWLVPFAFGRPDRIDGQGLWGYVFHQGQPPFFFALAPGLACVLALAATGVPRARFAWWGWSLALGGTALALGAFNPLVRAAVEAGLAPTGFRYPLRFWWLHAVGSALLVGWGAQRLWRAEGGARRRASIVAVAGAATYGVVALALRAQFAPLVEGLAARVPGAAARVAELTPLWRRTVELELLVILALGGAAYLARRRPLLGASTLAAIHLATQCALLSPALATDATSAYSQVPALLSVLPPEGRFASDVYGRLGPSRIAEAQFPDAGAHWLQRRAFELVAPSWAPALGRRFELNGSAEGFDTAASRAVERRIARADDDERWRLLAERGVDRVVLLRSLESSADPSAPALVARAQSFGRPVWVYRLQNPAPFARVGAGAVEAFAEARESLSADVSADAATTVTFERAWLPIYGARVDGGPTDVQMALDDRVAVAVPPGRHHVEVAVDRSSTRRAMAASLLAGIVLMALALARSRPSPPHEAVA